MNEVGIELLGQLKTLPSHRCKKMTIVEVYCVDKRVDI